MKLELNNRAKVLLGAVVLVGAAAAAWFLYLEEMVMGGPAPVATAPKPAATPAKPGAQPAAPAATAAAPGASPAGAAKPAAAANPDEVIAAVIEGSGLKAAMSRFGSEFAASTMSAFPAAGPADVQAVTAAGERIFEPRALLAEVSANLKKSYDAERMPKLADLLKDPIYVKMVGYENRASSPAEVKTFVSNYDRNRPSPERARLVARIDNASKSTELATDVSVAVAKITAERMIEEMQKAGMPIPASAKTQMSNELLSQKDKMRGEFFKMLHFTYRGVPDAELEQYAKLIDTDLGRWGGVTLTNAVRPALESRARAFGNELVQVAMASQTAAPAAKPRLQQVAATPEAPKPPAAAESQAPAAEAKPPAEQAPRAEPKVAAAPVYRRPDNLPELYTKYNDLITAVVMRDHAAAQELLQDGKNPNARQSDGQTALMIATANGDLEMVKALLAKGADPNLRGAQGTNALSLAKQVGRAELVRLLESHGGGK